MALVDERPTANVNDTERAGLEYIDPDGKKHTYYHARTLWLEVHQLQERVSTIGADDQFPEPRVVRFIEGLATVDKDYDVAVVGAPHTKTKTLPCRIRAGRWKRPEETPEDEQQSGLHRMRLTDSVGAATVGFVAADWEIGNDDSWFVECYTSQAVMDGLLAAVSTGRVASSSVGIQCIRGLYTTEDDMAPISSRGHLFLRPSKDENRTDMPGMADGDLAGVHLVLATPLVAMQLLPAMKDDVEETDDPLPSQALPTDGIAPVSKELLAVLMQLRGTLRWIAGGVILCALALLGGKSP